MKVGHSTVAEVTERVALCSEKVIQIGLQRLTPDKTKAYVECFLAHAFPMVTSDGFGMMPRVVVNSYGSMEHQVFDLAHIIKGYNPQENPRDRILGSVVGVELVNHAVRGMTPATVKERVEDGVSLRAVAVIHRQAEQAEEIIATYQNRQVSWTVSMEVDFFVDEMGFAVAGRNGVEAWEEKTPEDLRRLGVGVCAIRRGAGGIARVLGR